MNFDKLDHVETRGRPRKEPTPGAVKVTIELTPKSVANIDRVKAIAREVGWPVGSRSDIINAALAGAAARELVSVRSSLAECGDLLRKKEREAMEALTSGLPDLLTFRMTDTTREALAKIDRAYRKEEVNGGRAGLIERLILDVADCIP